MKFSPGENNHIYSMIVLQAFHGTSYQICRHFVE